MRKTYLPYGRQWIDEEDIAAVMESLKSDYITTGEKVAEFENKLASYCGAKYAVVVSSGTAALHCACKVAGISRGDEVITTPMTFSATIASIGFCEGIPILADVRDDTINIDPDEINGKITNKTKAILPVDLGGHPVDLDEIEQIAKNNNLIIIEDACHALGAEYKGHRVGSISDMTVFSFHPVKHITTGEGGAILTGREDYYEKLCAFRNHNIEKGLSHWQYEIHKPGYNYRLTDFQCALGISQLNKLAFFVARRREIAQMYNEAFADITDIVTPVELDYVTAAYHLYTIQLKGIDREGFIKALADENIGVQVHYIPVHFLSYMQREFGYKKGDFPKAEGYYQKAVSLPIFPKMSDGDVGDVIDAVRKAVASGKK